MSERFQLVHSWVYLVYRSSTVDDIIFGQLSRKALYVDSVISLDITSANIAEWLISDRSHSPERHVAWRRHKAPAWQMLHLSQVKLLSGLALKVIIITLSPKCSPLVLSQTVKFKQIPNIFRLDMENVSRKMTEYQIVRFQPYYQKPSTTIWVVVQTICIFNYFEQFVTTMWQHSTVADLWPGPVLPDHDLLGHLRSTEQSAVGEAVGDIGRPQGLPQTHPLTLTGSKSSRFVHFTIVTQMYGEQWRSNCICHC